MDRPLHLQVRYDQLVLASIGGLVGLTIVFASGVERGKRLARTERPIVAPVPQTAKAPATPEVLSTKRSEPVVSPAMPKAAAPSVPALKKGYAVQVVTYSQPQLATREVRRLKDQGEDAFVITNGARTMVYVGPFTSKGHAQKKVSLLKPRYGDCFVKSL